MKIDRYRQWMINVLAITFMGTQLCRTFAATHYVSQTSPNPTPPYSTPQTAAHAIDDGTNKSVTIPATDTIQLFRLYLP